MANLIAILTLAILYILIMMVVISFTHSNLGLAAMLAIFIVLAMIGIIVWNLKESSEKTEEWKKLTRASVILGIAFFAGDELLAFLHGQINPLRFAGGLLGLPLTLAVCPGFTLICVAGLVRAHFLTRVSKGLNKAIR